MTKSELIDRLAEQQKHLAHLDVELGVKSILEQMSGALAAGERIEIRGFGSFSLHYVRREWDVTQRPVKPWLCQAKTYHTSSPVKRYASGLIKVKLSYCLQPHTGGQQP